MRVLSIYELTVVVLEKDGHSQKRRHTPTVTHGFQRVSENRGPSNHPAVQRTQQDQHRNRSVSNRAFPTAPIVGTSKPGDELRDAVKQDSSEHNHGEEVLQGILGLSAAKDVAKNAPLNDAEVAEHGVITKLKTTPRRFHLTRSSLSIMSSRQASGVQKQKHYNRSKKEIATFVERTASIAETKLKQKSHKPETDDAIELDVSLQSQNRKTGTSMEDHPSTWDRDSDQLADELAAFALELDSDTAHTASSKSIDKPATRDDVKIVDHDVDMDEGMIEETYFRVPIEQMERDREGTMKNIGVLVIEEQDEELWENFIDDGEDSEWDEEDADSNAEDNPANDYPDEEVSSEDEYGYGSYKNRNRASDDEEYDLGNEAYSSDSEDHA